jgi:hypothetical protein
LFGDGIAWSVSLVEDSPLPLGTATSLDVLPRYCGRMPNWNPEVKDFDKGNPASKSSLMRYSPFLKECSLNLVEMIFGRHGRKSPCLVEKQCKLNSEVENQYTHAIVENQCSLIEYLSFWEYQVENRFGQEMMES